MQRDPPHSSVIHIAFGSGGRQDNLPPAMEKDYMQRIANGDREAFSRIVKLYMTDLYRFAYSILQDSGRAEDMAQETCLRLWNKAGQWSPSGRIKSWLLRIEHNLCLDELRGRKNTVDIEDIVLPDPGADQGKNWADQQRSRIVRAALFSLPERQRTALVLVYYHGYSNKEAADIMNLSIDATESLLMRGRRKMKDLLSQTKDALLEG